MKEDFNYSEVPYNYHHCLYAECPRSADCLRFRITKYVSPDIATISVINPTSVFGNEENCKHFQQNNLSRFALGITHLYDNIPHKKAVAIKRILFNHFQRNTYYRIQHKERLIKPEEQSFIREVFRREGIQEDPIFDEFVYRYDWQAD